MVKEKFFANLRAAQLHLTRFGRRNNIKPSSTDFDVFVPAFILIKDINA